MSMNSVLSKCIEELAKESPSVPYVRGMLETLLEMNSPVLGRSSTVEQRIVNPQVVGPIPTAPAMTEDNLLVAKERADMEYIKKTVGSAS